MMVVGSTIDDVITVQAPPTSSLRSESEAVSAGKNQTSHRPQCLQHGPYVIMTTMMIRMYIQMLLTDTKEPLSELTEHKKIIEKGIPEGVPPGLKHKRVS